MAKWISISKRLPEECVPVLVLIPDQDDHMCVATWERKEGWYLDYTGEAIIDEITHWISLPNIPAKEGGE